MAKKRSFGHARGRSGLPSATDIRASKSAFALISSAVPPGADSQDGGAVGPDVTPSRPMGDEVYGHQANRNSVVCAPFPSGGISFLRAVSTDARS